MLLVFSIFRFVSLHRVVLSVFDIAGARWLELRNNNVLHQVVV